jgi:hypothetical protein
MDRISEELSLTWDAEQARRSRRCSAGQSGMSAGGHPVAKTHSFAVTGPSTA